MAELIELFHTGGEIKEITKDGFFGEFLFFSCSIYKMSAGVVNVYKIEVDEDDFIRAGSLFYHDDAEKLTGLVSEFCDKYGVDEDTAEEIISERASAWNEIEDCDENTAWDVQRFAARAAKTLGYRGVRVQDEQGGAWMIDMLGREQELQLVGER